MGHKYRKKNQLRKQSRQRERARKRVVDSWLERVVTNDMARAMENHWRREIPWRTASVAASSATPTKFFWDTSGPAPRVSYDELMAWGKDQDDGRSVGELVGMEPKETYLVGERGPEVLLKSPPRRS